MQIGLILASRSEVWKLAILRSLTFYWESTLWHWQSKVKKFHRVSWGKLLRQLKQSKFLWQFCYVIQFIIACTARTSVLAVSIMGSKSLCPSSQLSAKEWCFVSRHMIPGPIHDTAHYKKGKEMYLGIWHHHPLQERNDVPRCTTSSSATRKARRYI